MGAGRSISNSHPHEFAAKSQAVGAIIIPDQPSGWGVGEGQRYLPGQPACRRVVGDAEMKNGSPMMAEHDQRIEAPERDRRYAQHVDRHNVAGMVAQESRPVLVRPAVSRQHVSRNGRLRDAIAKLDQLAMNARRPPERIVGADLADEADQIGVDARPAATRPGFPSPPEPPYPPMSADDVLGPNERPATAPATDEEAEAAQKKPPDHGAMIRRSAGLFRPGTVIAGKDKADIHTEKDRYHRFVCGHIPFTQRPNLEPLRCVTGANRAVMVSDFVEDAVSLSDICKRPDGRRVVYSLFDDALKSWRRHAFADVSDPKAPITEHLGDIMRVDRISSDVRTEARKFGAAKTPEALAQDLATCSTHEWKLGIIHGDLHPGNIMVRGAEAILIDFASVWDKKKPLVADLACLETGMCFTVAPEDCIKGPSKAKAFEQWCAAIDDLFSLSCLMRVPPQQEPTGMSWLRDACRQTRTLAAQLEATPAAYGAALALYLLRRARLGGAKNSKIEAYALLTAERIIGLLKSGDLGATS